MIRCKHFNRADHTTVRKGYTYVLLLIGSYLVVCMWMDGRMDRWMDGKMLFLNLGVQVIPPELTNDFHPKMSHGGLNHSQSAFPEGPS